jgi:hypothetical protein
MRGFVCSVQETEVREGRFMGTDLICELTYLQLPDPPIKERGLRPC